MYLLDTNVVSCLRTPRKIEQQGSAFETWAKLLPLQQCALSVVTLAELEVWVLSKGRKDPPAGIRLRQWLSQVQAEFANRILSIDATVAIRTASLHVPNPLSYRDAFIAATGLVYGLTIVTRNTGDFAVPGLAVLNPW